MEHTFRLQFLLQKVITSRITSHDVSLAALTSFLFASGYVRNTRRLGHLSRVCVYIILNVLYIYDGISMAADRFSLPVPDYTSRFCIGRDRTGTCMHRFVSQRRVSKSALSGLVPGEDLLSGTPSNDVRAREGYGMGCGTAIA